MRATRSVNLPFLVLDLSLHVVDRVRGLDLERNGLASKGLHEDLHTYRRYSDTVLVRGDH